ncbi:MAG: hypothetical protein QF489_05555 [Planctomycetota bacterium]|jgi:hypothetical protein|nr:hypothetical protein [Planctomycetota bacterium]
MPSTPAADATGFLLLQRADLERAVQRWRQRLPRPEALGTAAEIFESILGALWLELEACAKPMGNRHRCLRRVLYREYESSWRRSQVAIDHVTPWLAAPFSPDEPPLGSAAAELELPAHLLPWAEQYLRSGGPQGRLDCGTRLCGSRRHTRLRNSALFHALADGRFIADLHKRSARLMAAATVEGATPHLRLEARAILCMLKMLEPRPALTAMRDAVSNIAAARTPADHAGKVESANA